MFVFFFSSRRRHTRWNCDWSSDVCSSDLGTTISGRIQVLKPSRIYSGKENRPSRRHVRAHHEAMLMINTRTETSIPCRPQLLIGRYEAVSNTAPRETPSDPSDTTSAILRTKYRLAARNAAAAIWMNRLVFDGAMGR